MFEVHHEDRYCHINGVQGSCDASRDTSHQQYASDEFHQCDNRSRHHWHRDAGMPKHASHRVNANFKKLLVAVNEENDTYNDAKNR